VSQVHVRLASLRDYEALLHLDMEDDIMSNDIDATRLSLLLNDLRLPAVKQIWPSFAERSDKEGWPAARLLMALAEHEIAERDRRRPAGPSLDPL
jgi:hypothetical protein